MVYKLNINAHKGRWRETNVDEAFGHMVDEMKS